MVYLKTYELEKGCPCIILWVVSRVLLTSSVGPLVVVDVCDYSYCQRKLLPAVSLCYV